MHGIGSWCLFLWLRFWLCWFLLRCVILSHWLRLRLFLCFFSFLFLWRWWCLNFLDLSLRLLVLDYCSYLLLSLLWRLDYHLILLGYLNGWLWLRHESFLKVAQVCFREHHFASLFSRERLRLFCLIDRCCWFFCSLLLAIVCLLLALIRILLMRTAPASTTPAASIAGCTLLAPFLSFITVFGSIFLLLIAVIMVIWCSPTTSASLIILRHFFPYTLLFIKILITKFQSESKVRITINLTPHNHE